MTDSVEVNMEYIFSVKLTIPKKNNFLPPTPTYKKCVTSEDKFIVMVNIGNASFSVTWGVTHLQLQFPDFDFFIMRKS